MTATRLGLGLGVVALAIGIPVGVCALRESNVLEERRDRDFLTEEVSVTWVYGPEGVSDLDTTVRLLLDNGTDVGLRIALGDASLELAPGEHRVIHMLPEQRLTLDVRDAQGNTLDTLSRELEPGDAALYVYNPQGKNRYRIGEVLYGQHPSAGAPPQDRLTSEAFFNAGQIAHVLEPAPATATSYHGMNFTSATFLVRAPQTN
ncbi:MAG: hypothetical protein KDD82_21950 [Planctomycetes bacterium]|nr:hypothetical protein [Planctomycetota bacterium]